MKALVTGATGMIGTALCQRFEKNSIPHLQLSRNPSGSSKKLVYWNPEEKVLEHEKLREVDTVIHLAGENVGKRWTHNTRKKILSSRSDSSLFLFEKLAAQDSPPKTLIASSAIGIYGYKNSTQFDEESPRGNGFLADVVEAWEESAQPLKDVGCRVILMRQGLVLSPKGGALARMLPFFRFGLGGTLGSGQQMMSWIGMEDQIRAILFFLEDDTQSGVYNLVSPKPVCNIEFTAILGWVLKRPTLFPVPALALRAVFGEMAMQTMLASQHVIPKKLLQAGFEFKYPELEQALEYCLKHEN